MKPADAAEQLDPKHLQDEVATAMQRAVLIAEGAIKKRTRVRTGTLRRSWSGRVVVPARRGIVGSNIVYAAYQKNEPVVEGAKDAQPDIEREFAQAGVRFVARFS